MVEDAMYFSVFEFYEAEFEFVLTARGLFIEHAHFNTLKILRPQVEVF